MQVKSVLFGFGLGMVLFSAIFLIVYRFEGRQAGLLHEEVVLEQAADLGMVWPTEDVTEVVRQALEMGMVFLEEEEEDIEEEGIEEEGIEEGEEDSDYGDEDWDFDEEDF